MAKLNSLSIQRAKKPGLHADGNGLYLQVSRSGTKSWIFRFMLNKKARAMGLGPVDLVSLSEARIKSFECRRLLLEGTDPIEKRRLSRQEKALEAAKVVTFDECAKAYIEAHRSGWKNAKHASQWTNTLDTYASPVIGKLSIQSIDTALVMKVLEPIWREKTETASRLRNRMELVLAWATVRGFRVGDNPARWQGHLDHLLPKRSDVQRVQHFAALPFSEIGEFMARLRTLDGMASLALEFQILTATRPGEVFGARWSEFNMAEELWIIPPDRMKAKREHRVPLSTRALEILKAAQVHQMNDGFVFSGRSGKKPLSNGAFLALLKKRLGKSITAHGFRSTFRDWAAERTTFAREVVEMALAHTIKDATEAAYRRGDLILKRRVLMNEWSTFCSSRECQPGRVIEMNSAVQATSI